MVASPALKRGRWVGAAVVAAAVVIALASHGRRPDPGLVRFEPGGVMLHILPERVTDVRVLQADRGWQFTRAGAGAWAAAGSPLGPADLGTRLDTGLRFLHVSAPQRVLSREEFAGTSLAEFGLDPPRYSVSVHPSGGEPFTVQFGGPTPQGLAQYARIAGRDEILILPRFVGEQWEAVAGLR